MAGIPEYLHPGTGPRPDLSWGVPLAGGRLEAPRHTILWLLGFFGDPQIGPLHLGWLGLGSLNEQYATMS